MERPYRIRILRLWRHGRGHTHPGVYKVPKHLSYALAELAEKHGVGVREVDPGPAAAAETASATTEITSDQATGKQRRRRRRAKGPAPENKALSENSLQDGSSEADDDAAPDNHAALD